VSVEITVPANMAAALSKFQGAVGVIHKDKKARIDPKDPTKRGFEYKYADLASIAEQAYPLLAQNGLSFTASPTMGERGFVLEYALMHESGEDRCGSWPLPDPRSVDIKQIGIAITYARRYCFSAVTGIVTEEDTDTQGAPEPQRAGRPQQTQQTQQRRPQQQPDMRTERTQYGPNAPRTDDQSNKIFAMLGELGIDYKAEAGRDEVLTMFSGWLQKDLASTKDLTKRDARQVIDNLQSMLDGGPMFVTPETGEVPRAEPPPEEG